MNRSRYNWLLEMLPLWGFVFWFLTAFPLANRNESYIWIAFLEEHSLLEILQHPIPSIRGFRPLAQAVTWCLYHLSANSGMLIQATNVVLLCVAVLIIVRQMEHSKAHDARVLYLITGFIFFPAFYYVFNLHGIFYSVILLVVALMLKAQGAILRNWKTGFSACLILAFFHPLILILYMAYLLGWVLENHRTDHKTILLLVILAFVVLAAMQLVAPFPILSLIDIQNLLGTMNNVERYVIIKIFTLLLCALTLFQKIQPRAFHVGVIVVSLPLAIIYDIPLLLTLGFLVIVSLFMERKWSLACLVMAAMCFPLTVGSGAPTKASIFIFLLPFVLLRPLSFSFINQDWIPKAMSFVILTAILFCATMVKLETNIPLISSLIRPLLVEKGKTFQLQEALKLAQQQVPPRRIVFLQQKQANIRDKGQPKDRANFPPAKQTELDFYQQCKFAGHSWRTLPKWYITFGKELPSDTLVLVGKLDESNCEPAYVYQHTSLLPLSDTLPNP